MEGVELRPLRRREKRGLRESGGGEASLCAARARSEAGERGAKDGLGADRGHGARARAAEANGGGGRDGDLADFPHTCARRCRGGGEAVKGEGGPHRETFGCGRGGGRMAGLVLLLGFGPSLGRVLCFLSSYDR